MSSNIILDRAGVSNLLNSEVIASACASLANAVAAGCGEGWEAAAPHRTGQRVAVNVYPTTTEAARDNAENDTARRVIQSMEVLL